MFGAEDQDSDLVYVEILVTARQSAGGKKLPEHFIFLWFYARSGSWSLSFECDFGSFTRQTLLSTSQISFVTLRWRLVFCLTRILRDPQLRYHVRVLATSHCNLISSLIPGDWSFADVLLCLNQCVSDSSDWILITIFSFPQSPITFKWIDIEQRTLKAVNAVSRNVSRGSPTLQS